VETAFAKLEMGRAASTALKTAMASKSAASADNSAVVTVKAINQFFALMATTLRAMRVDSAVQIKHSRLAHTAVAIPFAKEPRAAHPVPLTAVHPHFVVTAPVTKRRFSAPVRKTVVSLQRMKQRYATTELTTIATKRSTVMT
jgi:hypothetical protein